MGDELATVAAEKSVRCLLLVAVAGLVAGWPAAAAGESPKPTKKEARAKAHLLSGKRLLDKESYERALEELRAGHELSQKPEFLPFIGRCQRMLGNAPQALEAYRRFLTEEPASPSKDEVQAAIAELEKEAAPAPAEAASTPSAAAPGVPPAPETQVAMGEDEVRARLLAMQARSKDEGRGEPKGSRLWLWLTVGAVVIAGAVVGVYLLASPRYETSGTVGQWDLRQSAR